MAVLTKWEPYGPTRGRIDFVVNGGPGRVVVESNRIFYTDREGGYIEDVPPGILTTHGEFLKNAMREVK